MKHIFEKLLNSYNIFIEQLFCKREYIYMATFDEFKIKMYICDKCEAIKEIKIKEN